MHCNQTSVLSIMSTCVSEQLSAQNHHDTGRKTNSRTHITLPYQKNRGKSSWNKYPAIYQIYQSYSLSSTWEIPIIHKYSTPPFSHALASSYMPAIFSSTLHVCGLHHYPSIIFTMAVLTDPGIIEQSDGNIHGTHLLLTSYITALSPAFHVQFPEVFYLISRADARRLLPEPEEASHTHIQGSPYLSHNSCASSDLQMWLPKFYYTEALSTIIHHFYIPSPVLHPKLGIQPHHHHPSQTHLTQKSS